MSESNSKDDSRKENSKGTESTTESPSRTSITCERNSCSLTSDESADEDALLSSSAKFSIIGVSNICIDVTGILSQDQISAAIESLELRVENLTDAILRTAAQIILAIPDQGGLFA
jgi:hypothetical protein